MPPGASRRLVFATDVKTLPKKRGVGAPGAPAQVLVIDDEAKLVHMMAAGLNGHGYRVLTAASTREGLNIAAQYRPDVVLLDLGLPDLDGTVVIGELRGESTVPIIVLTAHLGEADKIAALDAGADDYLTKPFGFGELLARLRVALRHAARIAKPGGATTLACGPLSVDLEARRGAVDGREVKLTPIEFKLLAVLAQNPGRVMTHGTLLKAVWGLHGTERSHYLRVYMTHLRRKLEPDPHRPKWLLTDPGVGYRLEC
jgi:two-component system KDP operon response regulator KdpE